MNTIQDEVIYEQIINKSRFICYLFPVKNNEEVNNCLNSIRKKHYDANHNCYSYILGEDSQTAKSSDDKEPAGTAGVVIYDVLRKNNLTNVLAIVTRYFGGIKLGAGGLIRAYSSSVAKAVECATVMKIEKTIKLSLTFSYSYWNVISKLIEKYEEVNKIFTEEVMIKIIIPDDQLQTLTENLIEITKNNIIIKEEN